MACKKSGVQIPSAPQPKIPRVCGGFCGLEPKGYRSRSSWSPRRVRERLCPSGFECCCGLLVSAFEEVPVDVVGGADGGVAEASGYDVGVFAGGDEQGDMGVTKVMWSHGFSDRVSYCWVPNTATEQFQP